MAQSWFIMRDDSRIGPFTHHGLVSLAANGGLKPDDMVWCSDLPAPMQAIGVAGLFPDPAPVSELAHEPEEPGDFADEPRPPDLSFPTVSTGASLARPRRDKFAALFEEGSDAAESGSAPDEALAAIPDPTVPRVGRPTRKAVPSRQKKADNAGLLIGLGGLSLLFVIVLIVVLEQGDSRPVRPRPTPKPPTPTVRPVTSPPAPPTVTRPERRPPAPPPPPPPPPFDKQPLIEAMAKATVDGIFEAAPSVKPRYRTLWETQLQALLEQESKGMRDEQQVRVALQQVCDAWSVDTRNFIAEESAPPPPPDAIDNASDMQADPDAPTDPDEPMELGVPLDEAPGLDSVPDPAGGGEFE